MIAQIELMWRKLLLTIGRARVMLVDDSKAVQLAQVQLDSSSTLDPVPRLAEYGFTSNPPPGADAVTLSLGGNRADTVIIATGHQSYRLKSLASGEVALYDMFGQVVKLGASGITITAPLGATVNGNLAVNGNTTFTGSVTANGHAIDNTHKHTGVQAGSSDTGTVL